jgi:hypothetical protein
MPSIFMAVRCMRPDRRAEARAAVASAAVAAQRARRARPLGVDEVPVDLVVLRLGPVLVVISALERAQHQRVGSGRRGPALP